MNLSVKEHVHRRQTTKFGAHESVNTRNTMSEVNIENALSY